MIYEKQNIYGATNVTVFEFGTGDINISSAGTEDESSACVYLSQNEPGQIGQSVVADITKMHTLLTFKNVESVDVMIDQFRIVRKYLKEYEKNNRTNNASNSNRIDSDAQVQTKTRRIFRWHFPALRKIRKRT